MSKNADTGSITPGPSLDLKVLPVAQRRLWDELSGTPEYFVLYGGTAIALRLGHRQSIDFYFFAFRDIDPGELARTVPYLARAKNARTQPNTLDAIVERGGEVHVSFFGLEELRQVRPALQLDSPKIKIADLLDLAGMKMAVIQQRARAKDYLDIHAIWSRTEITAEYAVAAASIIYGEQFNPYDTLKALAYYGEPELASLPEDLKSALIRYGADEPVYPGAGLLMPTIFGRPADGLSKLPATNDVLGVARRLVWYKAPGEAIADTADFLAHLMTFGRPEDVAVILRHLNMDDFRMALERAPAGIMDARSWNYWNLVTGRVPVPAMPRRRLE